MSKVTDKPTDAEKNGVDIADGSDESVTYVCPDCGAPMIIIETFGRSQLPRAPPSPGSAVPGRRREDRVTRHL